MNRRSIPSLFAIALMACLASTGAQAQDSAKRLVGTWGIERPGDKETNETVTTLLEFRGDGSYSTRVRSSVFKDQEKQTLASGRYSIADDAGKAFTLVLDRNPGDPEESKETAVTRIAVSVLDDNTLRAEDGSTVRRTR